MAGRNATRVTALEGTVIVHDWATWILIVLVIGHLYLALVHPSTQHALRGIDRGRRSRLGARTTPKWVDAEDAADLKARGPRHSTQFTRRRPRPVNCSNWSAAVISDSGCDGFSYAAASGCVDSPS